MKKLQHLTIALLMLVIFISCHRHRHVTIATQSNDVSIKIDYEGTIVLNSDKSRIEGISPDGYIDYNKNGNRIYAARDHEGNIFYEFNGERITRLNGNGQALLAEAIGMIAKEQSGR